MQQVDLRELIDEQDYIGVLYLINNVNKINWSIVTHRQRVHRTRNGLLVHSRPSNFIIVK